MTTSLRIEELSSSDEEVCIALWQETELTRPWNNPSADFQRALNGPSSTILGIREGSKLVACVMVGHDGHRGWLYYLAVKETKRRQGIAKELVDAATQWCLQRGITKMQLMVRSANTEALGFYDQLGFDTDDVVVRSKRIAEFPND